MPFYVNFDEQLAYGANDVVLVGRRVIQHRALALRTLDATRILDGTQSVQAVRVEGVAAAGGVRFRHVEILHAQHARVVQRREIHEHLGHECG